MDDSLLVGHPKAIQQIIDDLEKEGFDLKLDGSLDDYLRLHLIVRKRWDGLKEVKTKRKNYNNKVIAILRRYIELLVVTAGHHR